MSPLPFFEILATGWPLWAKLATIVLAVALFFWLSAKTTWFQPDPTRCQWCSSRDHPTQRHPGPPAPPR